MNRQQRGFTIVELIVIIVVIGILAAISVVGYGAWQRSLAESAIKSDLQNAAAAMQNAQNFDDSFPANVNTVFNASENVTITGGLNGEGGFCIQASVANYPELQFYMTEDGASEGVQTGTCPFMWQSVFSSDSAGSSCGLGTGGLYCWGLGTSGQLGRGNYSDSSVPVAVNTSGVLSGRTVQSVGVGGSHTCVVADSLPFCWGNGSNGRLGRNSTTTSPNPVAVTVTGVLNGRTVTAISAGSSHTCAIADGLPFCWGNGANGRLGNNSSADSLVPVAVDTSGVLAGRTVTAISAGSSHTCAIADGLAFCWGAGTNRQLGNNSTTDSLVPVAVSTSGLLSGKAVTDIVAGGAHSCAVAGGLAYCWGAPNNGRLGNNNAASFMPIPVAVDTTGVLAGLTVTDLAIGSGNTCAIADERAFCWGGNTNGRLGNGLTTDSSVPVAVMTTGLLADKKVTSIASAIGQGCVVANTQAYCWGAGTNGRLGNGSTDSSLDSVLVTNPSL